MSRESSPLPIPPGVTHSFESNSLEDATERFAAIYGKAPSLSVCGRSSDGFEYRSRAAQFGETMLIDSVVANWKVRLPLGERVSITLPLSRALNHSSGARTTQCKALKTAGVGRPHEVLQFGGPGHRAIAFYAPLQSIWTRAERLLDADLTASSRELFAESIDLSTPIGEVLSQNLQSAARELENIKRLGVGAVAFAGYDELLLNIGVAAVFPRIAEKLMQPQPDCGPIAIRRAKTFLDEHADEPIQISALAQMLGVSMRSLQENFRRRYGVAPREYLSAVRLENARKMLLSAENVSVTAAAMSCGFGDLSYFSANYRRKYGELPSDTLRRVRGYGA